MQREVVGVWNRLCSVSKKHVFHRTEVVDFTSFARGTRSSISLASLVVERTLSTRFNTAFIPTGVSAVDSTSNFGSDKVLRTPLIRSWHNIIFGHHRLCQYRCHVILAPKKLRARFLAPTAFIQCAWNGENRASIGLSTLPKSNVGTMQVQIIIRKRQGGSQQGMAPESFYLLDTWTLRLSVQCPHVCPGALVLPCLALSMQSKLGVVVQMQYTIVSTGIMLSMRCI